MTHEMITALRQAAREMSSCDPGAGRSYTGRLTCAEAHPDDPKQWCAGCVLAALSADVPDCSVCGRWSGGEPLCVKCLASPAPHGDAGLREPVDVGDVLLRFRAGELDFNEAFALLDAPPTAAQASPTREPETCAWRSLPPTIGLWSTSCGYGIETDALASYDAAKFCPFCGRQIVDVSEPPAAAAEGKQP